jgi:hypothetical protein
LLALRSPKGPLQSLPLTLSIETETTVTARVVADLLAANLKFGVPVPPKRTPPGCRKFYARGAQRNNIGQHLLAGPGRTRVPERKVLSPAIAGTRPGCNTAADRPTKGQGTPRKGQQPNNGHLPGQGPSGNCQTGCSVLERAGFD